WISWTSHWKSSIVSGVSGRIQAAPFSLTAPIRLSFRQPPPRCRVGVGGKLTRSVSQRILVTRGNVCYTPCQMILEGTGHIELPAHAGPGGFDHAAVHGRRGRLYVAHTANDALDVIDCATNTYLGSIPGLEGVAGALVSEEHDLVFTSNRGENTVGIFPADREEALVKVKVGLRPNGLAYDPGRRLLLAANVGDPATPGSFTVSMVDVAAGAMVADVPVPGRTRWAVFDSESGCFYVNIADPPRIVV